MEILSDATFKGNLNVNGEATFSKNVNFNSTTNFIGTVYGSEFKSAGPITGFCYKIFDSSLNTQSWVEYGQERGCSANHGILHSCSSEFHYTTTTFGAKVELKNACIGDGSVNFIGLTSSNGSHFNQNFQNKCGTIALTSDIKVVPEVKIGYCSGINKDVPTDCTLFTVDIGQTVKSVISATVEKHYGEASGCTLIDGCFWENTDIDIFQSTKHPNSTFFIRKASGTMAQENGIHYSLKVVYI